MDLEKVRIGMICVSHKGSGTVSWIDGSTRTIYLTDLNDNHSFDVSIDEIIDDPQIHNHDDYYY